MCNSSHLALAIDLKHPKCLVVLFPLFLFPADPNPTPNPNPTRTQTLTRTLTFQALQTFVDAEDVATAALLALLSLSVKPQHRQRLLESQAIGLVLKALERHEGNATIEVRGGQRRRGDRVAAMVTAQGWGTPRGQ